MHPSPQPDLAMLSMKFLLGVLSSGVSLGARQAWVQEQQCRGSVSALLESRACCVLENPESDAASFWGTFSPRSLGMALAASQLRYCQPALKPQAHDLSFSCEIR